MEDAKHVTQTAPKVNIVYFSVIALLLGIAAVAAYRLLPQFDIYIFIVGALGCIACFGTGLILAASPPVTLRFKNDELFISDSNGKEYKVYAVTADDFVFMQTPMEKKYNIGCLRIKQTAFFMVGVKNILETKAYIHAQFPHWE